MLLCSAPAHPPIFVHFIPTLSRNPPQARKYSHDHSAHRSHRRPAPLGQPPPVRPQAIEPVIPFRSQTLTENTMSTLVLIIIVVVVVVVTNNSNR
ncbi:MAG: hypothetical protein K2W95_31585 [Candidatus Obscuribacterales bacterium]|nr:hypothetical protein [Candidatus Obscuribacterales bacterium]